MKTIVLTQSQNLFLRFLVAGMRLSLRGAVWAMRFAGTAILPILRKFKAR